MKEGLFGLTEFEFPDKMKSNLYQKDE